MTEPVENVTIARLRRENLRLEQLYQTAYRFVDNVSHEFRTPLTVIKEFTSILRDGLVGPVNDQQREHLDVIAQRVDELAGIANEMFELSQMEVGKLAMRRIVCRPDEIIDRIHKTMQIKANRQGVSLELDLPGDLPDVYCDPDKASRVIVHLMDQLLTTLPADGHVQLRILSDPAHWQIVVQLTDDGPGLEQEELRSITERFRELPSDVRSNPKGLDLGLNIAKELVYLNLGEIAVESEPETGTTYRFTIPIADIAKVAGRYLERLRQVRGAEVGASLVAASVDRHVSLEVADDVDRFLQRAMRCSDLLFRLDVSSWLLLMAGQSHDVDAMMNRIEQQHQQANRNRPGTALPAICLGVRDRWSFGREGNTCTHDAAPTASSSVSRRILLVDDDRDVVEGVAIRLQTAGFDVLTAYNGEQALELASELNPDAVLLDIRMPVMDGLRALSTLRECPRTREIPVAIMSGRLADKDRALELGASCFIEKPYETSALIEAVESMTAEPALNNGGP